MAEFKKRNISVTTDVLGSNQGTRALFSRK